MRSWRENALSDRKRRKLAAENAAVLWCVSMLVAVLAWKTIAWAIHRLAGTDLGWHGKAAVPVTSVLAFTCAIYSLYSTRKWLASSRSASSELAQDLAGAEVIEEHYVLSEAKRFQEQEHGGLMYFLRTTDNRVLVLFDHESASLGAAGEDPLTSQFTPKTALTLIRAPKTRFIVSQHFGGDVLSPGEPIDLTNDYERWPEQEEYCDVPWEALEATFGLVASNP